LNCLLDREPGFPGKAATADSWLALTNLDVANGPLSGQASQTLTQSPEFRRFERRIGECVRP
jgi:hypothetical protein